MRLLVLCVFVSLICLAYGKEATSNPFTRFFGGLFGRRQQKLNSAVADPLTKEDFDSQLPRESTDRMISNAIEDRFLEEAQESAGSPFIQAPDSDLKTDEEKFTANQADENVSSQDVTSNRGGKSMPNAEANAIPLTEALRIVNTSNLQDCVARVICELSCNANAYGNEGRVVFRNLIKLQFDQKIKNDDAKFFRQAASKGRQIVQGKRNCNECYTIYAECRSDSKDLVAVSSMFKL